MGFIPAAITGLSAIAGLFGNKQKSQGTVDQTTTNTPTFDPTSQAFRDQLIGMFTGRLNGAGSDGTFQQAYTGQGLKNILNTSQTANDALSNILASRGLSRTTAGGFGQAQLGYNQGNSITNFLNSVPLTMDARTSQLMRDAGGFFSSIPYGTSSHVTGRTTGNYTYGGGAGGAIQGGAQGLAGYLGQLSAQNSLYNIMNPPANLDLTSGAPDVSSLGGAVFG